MAKINWKIVVGLLLIFGSIKELFSILQDYRSGKLAFWPFGADLACLAVVALGVYLIRKGQREKRQL